MHASLPRVASACVVGAGVVGLAITRALCLAGHTGVLCVDAAPAVGSVTSSRNSGVVHAGLYYRPGSLKATACVAGGRLLKAFCAARGVACVPFGKLVVATSSEQEEQLELLRVQATSNGVDDLVMLTGRQARRLEPALRAHAALLSPSTSVVDVSALVASLKADCEALGAAFALSTSFLGADASPGGPGAGFAVRLRLPGGAEGGVRCASLVNAAGLSSTLMSSSVTGVRPADVPTLYRCRGAYARWVGDGGGGGGGTGGVEGSAASAEAAAAATQRRNPRLPFSRLVYPLPPASGGGLGVHATLTADGGALRFGPDVEWLDTRSDGTDRREEAAAAHRGGGSGRSKEKDAARLGAFYESVRDYFPACPDGALVLEDSRTGGIRTKLVGPGQAASPGGDDFRIETHGVPGFVALYGIESPGLTSSLALGDLVAAQLAHRR